MLLNEIFNSTELDNIIERGIKIGIERAKDENILCDITYNLKNGESDELEKYKERLTKNKLEDKDKLIINKYRGIE